MLFRTNESSFVETKRKLVDECDLWAIVSLPGGVFSTAGAGVKTNLLFFTKGKKTERIWYYDLSHVKVGKKSPLTLAHFGFDKDGKPLADSALPANLTADWLEQEENAGKPFSSYARLLPLRGKAEADSRYSWTIDFAARRAKAREEMQPILAQAAETKAEVIDLKEKLKRLKKLKSSDAEVAALIREINEKEKAARELEAQAAAIDAAVFDLKAVNPSTVAKFDDRSPAEIIQSIHDQGRIVAEALARLAALVGEDETNVPSARAALR
jgi:type I restriction enzyme M protein